MIPAFEIMVLTPAIRNLIREGKVHQINGIIYTSAAENMIAMDSSILQLYKDGRVHAISHPSLKVAHPLRIPSHYER